MLAEFFCARVGILVGAIPIDRGVLGDDFVAASSSYGDGRDLAEAAQAVGLMGAAGQLRDFQRPPKIHVEAAFFRLAVERCGAVDYRLGRSDQTSVLGMVQAKTRIGEIASKYKDARFEGVPELGKIQMQLQRLPEAFVRLLFRFRAPQQIQPIRTTMEENCADVRAAVAGRTGPKNSPASGLLLSSRRCP